MTTQENKELPQEESWVREFILRQSVTYADSFLDYGDDDCPPVVNWENVQSFIHKTREEAYREGFNFCIEDIKVWIDDVKKEEYKKGYKDSINELTASVLHMDDLKDIKKDIWNLAIQACVGKVEEIFNENTKTSNKILNLIRTSLVSLKK